MAQRRVALVTGASRGIGKAASLRLAEAGFDVALTARTVKEGEGRADVNSVRENRSMVVVPGSLETTAKEVEERGGRALSIPMDLLDAEAVVAAPAAVLAEWGRIDVIFNNAIFQGGGTMDRVLDLTPASMTRVCVGNYVHQVLLIQQVVPHMLERGTGRIINMVSGSARLDPTAAAGDGGWGIAYSASKAAFARVAGGLNAEFGPGILAFNVDPGNVITEKRKALSKKDEFEDAYGAQSADETALAVAWLATHDDASTLLGKWIYAPKLTKELGLGGS